MLIMILVVVHAGTCRPHQVSRCISKPPHQPAGIRHTAPRQQLAAAVAVTQQAAGRVRPGAAGQSASTEPFTQPRAGHTAPAGWFVSTTVSRNFKCTRWVAAKQHMPQGICPAMPGVSCWWGVVLNACIKKWIVPMHVQIILLLCT